MANSSITDIQQTFLLIQTHLIGILIESSPSLHNSVSLFSPFSTSFWEILLWLLCPPCVAPHKHTTSWAKKRKYIKIRMTNGKDWVTERFGFQRFIHYVIPNTKWHLAEEGAFSSHSSLPLNYKCNNLFLGKLEEESSIHFCHVLLTN